MCLSKYLTKNGVKCHLFALAPSWQKSSCLKKSERACFADVRGGEEERPINAKHGHRVRQMERLLPRNGQMPCWLVLCQLDIELSDRREP